MCQRLFVCLFIILTTAGMDFFFQDKKTPVMLSRQLRTMIQTIGQTKNKQQQEQIINKQINSVREQIANGGIQNDQYPDVLVKLIYFQTMGYDASFAHILPINLCQSSNIYIKKMAYLLAAMLIRPGQGVAMLMHNTLVKDLNSQNLYIQMIALTMLRYFLTQDIVSEVLPLLNKMRKHNVNMIRRKSLLVMLNIHHIHPHLVPDIKSLAVDAFNDGDPPVVFAGISVLSNAVKEDPLSCKDLTKRLSDIMFNIVDHKYPHEYDYHKIPAPWAQIQILKMFQALARNDQNATTQVVDAIQRALRRASNFQMHFNKAIIQQCIKTIANIYPHRYLLQQAEQSLGRFFESGNNNMKYFGIVALTQLAKVRKEVIDKWQILLLQCMDSTDITLAERTLSLLVQIANPQNTTIILDRIISLTEKSTDDQQRMNLIGKALVLIEKFSEDRQIFLRRMNQIFYKFQSLISDQSVTNFLKVLLEIAELDQNFPDMAVNTYTEILLHFKNPTLMKVSAWAVAEFTYTIYLRDRDTEIVDKSVQALLHAASDYVDDRKITFLTSTSIAKLATITTLKEAVKEYWLSVSSSQDFFLSTTGQEMIKMVKYSKAFYNSSDLSFDKNMGFLSKWAEENGKTPKNSYLISKAKLAKRPSYDIFENQNEVNGIIDQNSQNVTKHDFKFSPGNRWGLPQDPQENKIPTNYAVPIVQSEQRKKELTLRGPHQQKKAKNIIDQRKQRLAKSIFGPKKK